MTHAEYGIASGDLAGDEQACPSTGWSDYILNILAMEPRMRACLASFTRNRADTDELLQEAYARLLTIGADSTQSIRSARAFALVVARNVGIDWLKHKNTLKIDHVPSMEVLGVMSAEPTEEVVNCDQEIDLLVASVSRLPSRCRQVFTLRKVYGFSQREVARRLGLSVNTVEQHMLKAARSLARDLKTPSPRFSMRYPFKPRNRRIAPT